MQVETHRELVTVRGDQLAVRRRERVLALEPASVGRDRKSTRLNSSHQIISYAVFCLEQKSTRLNSSHQIISYAVFCLKKNRTNHHTSHKIVSNTALRLPSQHIATPTRRVYVYRRAI